MPTCWQEAHISKFESQGHCSDMWDQSRPVTFWRPPPRRLIIGHPFKPIFFTLFSAYYRAGNIFWRRVPKLWAVFLEILRRVESWEYHHHCSNYSRDVKQLIYVKHIQFYYLNSGDMFRPYMVIFRPFFGTSLWIAACISGIPWMLTKGSVGIAQILWRI
jgi:hypothetical protein